MKARNAPQSARARALLILIIDLNGDSLVGVGRPIIILVIVHVSRGAYLGKPWINKSLISNEQAHVLRPQHIQ